MKLTISALLLVLSAPLFAKDLGFRYTDGKCINSAGEEGLNSGYFGQCSDFRNTTIRGLDLNGVDLSGSHFESADVQQTTLQQSNLTAVNFSSTDLSGVDFDGAILHQVNFTNAVLVNSVFGTADLLNSDFSGADMAGASLSFLSFPGCKFSGAKLNGAIMDNVDMTGLDLTGVDLSSVNLENSIFDGVTLDNAIFNGAFLNSASFKKASGKKVNFRGAKLNPADLSSANFSDSNFRQAILEGANLDGASFDGSDMRSVNMKDCQANKTTFLKTKINKRTILPFSMDEAVKRGMEMSTSGSVFLLWDSPTPQDPQIVAFKQFLETQDVEVTMAPRRANEFTGTEDMGDATAILHLLGNDDSIVYSTNLSDGAQTALVNFVNNGGTYIATEWISYMYTDQDFLQKMRDLVLLDRQTGTTSELIVNTVLNQKSHPVLEDVPDSFSISGGFSQGMVHTFSDHPVQVLMTDAQGYPFVMAREYGQGRVVNF
jgi:uncharacterized protein YjbI with pentapeptide repeats